MERIWEKNYIELAKAGRKGIYAAYVGPHAWDGWWVFRAYPERGDHCTEFLSEDKELVLTKAEQWFKGEMPEGIYSAAY
jgi:hypothetical protein